MKTFPILLPEYTTLVHDERHLLDNANALLASFDIEPLKAFSDIYRASVSMPRTIRQLDPYDGLRTSPLLPPLNEAVPRGTGAGEDIFVYFSTAETAYAPLVDALCGLELPVRAFLPGASLELLDRLGRAGVIVEAAPVPVELIAQRSRLMLNAGQHGSLCMGLGLGIPQLTLPQHLEHLFHARRASDLGAAEIVPYRSWEAWQIIALAREMYFDPARQSRARELADALCPDLFGDISGLVRARVEPLLA